MFFSINCYAINYTLIMTDEVVGIDLQLLRIRLSIEMELECQILRLDSKDPKIYKSVTESTDKVAGT